MNNDIILIDDSAVDTAKSICQYIEDPQGRNRAVANVLTAKLAKVFFEDREIDTESGLHNIATVLDRYEISDIYIDGTYFDIRLYFTDNGLCVPKLHFEKGLLPVAYMFIKVTEDISEAAVAGFITPDKIDTSKEYDGYYKIDEKDLVSFYDVEPLLITNNEIDLPEDFDKQVFEYLDGELQDSTDFYQILLGSKEARIKLLNADKVKNILKFVSIVPDTDFTQNESSSEVIDEALQADDLESLESSDYLSDTYNGLDLEPSDTIEEFEMIQEELVIADNENIVDIDSIQDLDDNGLIDNIDEPLDFYEPIEEFSDNTIEDSNVIFEEIEENDDSAENDSYHYSTNTTPSIDSFEAESSELEECESNKLLIENEQEDFSTESELEDFLEEDHIEQDVAAEENIDNNEEEEIFEDESKPQIDDLFGQEPELADSSIEEEMVSTISKPKRSALPALASLLIVAALGYYGYTKFFNNNVSQPEQIETPKELVQPQTQNETKKEAMPNETVENVKNIQAENEGTAISIPAIEQNLDASIIVSNLSVNWEVPANYITSNTAKRYFTKIGKIIQLNLKTELLLLSKPPITNKIALELEFNKSLRKFDIKGIITSSGEKTVDDLIVQTVKKALSMSSSVNMNAFGNLTGNPVLVIKL